jgi:D-cysteine desulfhydrase
VAKDAGIVLDPVYSGKAMLGLVDQIKKGKFPEKERILFLHTGGGFGLFPIKERFFK